MKTNNGAGYTALNDRDDFNIVFVNKDLDDFGLDPYSFRVYSRIVRRAGRGEAFETNKNMAVGCRMSEAQIKRSLATLVNHGLIIKESRPGTTCLYRVAPRRNWSDPIPPKGFADTDSSDRPIRNYEVTNDSNYLRVAQSELGGSSGRTRGVSLTELQSISNLNKSKEHTQDEKSVCVNSLNSEKTSEVVQNSISRPSSEVPNSVNNSPVLKVKSCLSSLNNHKEKNCYSSLDSQQTMEKIMRAANVPMEDADQYLKHVASTLKAKSVGAALTAVQRNPARAGLEYQEWKKSIGTVVPSIMNNSMDDMPHTFHAGMRYQYKSRKLESFLKLDLAALWLDWAQSNHPEWFPIHSIAA